MVSLRMTLKPRIASSRLGLSTYDSRSSSSKGACRPDCL
jgi:hypothetical protein